MDCPMLTTAKNINAEASKAILRDIRRGDIILSANNLFPGWKLIARILGNGKYTHSGIYEGDGIFIEATTFHKSGFGVGRTDLRRYLKKEYSDICIFRPPYTSQASIDKGLDYAVAQIGKDFDLSFDSKDNSKHYCSGLIAKSLAAADERFIVPAAKTLGWEIVLPADILNIEGGVPVYESKTGRQTWLNPAFLGGIAVGIVGVAFGTAGVVAGFLLGTFVTLVVGGNIQFFVLKNKKINEANNASFIL